MNPYDDQQPRRRPSGEARARAGAQRAGARTPVKDTTRGGRSAGPHGQATARARARNIGPGRARPGQSRKRPLLRVIALLAVLAAVALAVSGCAAYNHIANSLPDPSKPLKGTDLTTRVLDRNGTPITSLYADQNRTYVPLKDIPRTLQEAVIATEDQRYYEHAGVDLIGMLRALWTDIRAGSQVQGGSTITQQYVKQAFVGDQRTISRKISEAILAYRVEKQYGKDKILEMYLNTIYFGHGAYGVQTAAQTYFGTTVDKLTVAQAAMIAGVIKSPGRYSPYLDPAAAKLRRDTVLGQMRDQGYINAAQYAQAVATPIKTAGLKQASAIAPYFIEYVKTLLVARYGADAVYRGGLTVTTSLDTASQKAAERAVAANLDRPADPSAALVAIQPKTGEIVAMVGGRDFSKQQFNVAVQGHRQSGSSFKPFVLVTALEDGISPEATFTANSTSLKIPGGQTWAVAGEPGFKGPMRLRVATWHSINPVFAQLVLKLGASHVVDTARAMGVATTITPVPAVALGGMAEGVTPLEMASAYGTLAAGGMHTAPIAILKVTDKSGKVLYEAQPQLKREVPANVAYLTTDILKGVITGGTGTAAKIGRPAAGKTGTTQQNSDAWFVGYTPDLVASVWVGYADSKKPMTSVHGITVTGGSFPARIWAAFMKAALKNTPATQFARPTGLVDVKICQDTGLKATQFCPKTASGLFLAGQEPVPCTLHASPVGGKMPTVVGLAKADAIAALTKLSLRYTVVSRTVSGVAAGTVAEQTPVAGSAISSATVVTLVVSDGGGGTNLPPTAAFTWTPASPSTGGNVRFDASASTDGGTIVKWVWEFGDGAKDPSSGRIATHRYAAAGSYAVTLWITDDAGATVSITKRVTVK